MRSKLRVVEGCRPASIFQDLEALRIPHDDEDPEEAPQPVEAKEIWQDGTFAMMSKLWHDRLKETRASGDLYRLAWILLYRANLKSRFPLTEREMFAAGVARRHKRELLERLEAAGLIRIEWKPAPWVPTVTVLHRVRRRRGSEEA